jgi:hypothetical protein
MFGQSVMVGVIMKIATTYTPVRKTEACTNTVCTVFRLRGDEGLLRLQKKRRNIYHSSARAPLFSVKTRIKDDLWRSGGERNPRGQENEDLNHGDYPMTDMEEQAEGDEEVQLCAWGGCERETDTMKELYVS